MNRINVVGDSLIDLSFALPRQFIHRYQQQQKLELPFGEKLSTEGYALDAGGSGNNVAVGMHRAGYKVWFHTGLATDVFGDFLRTFLGSNDISVDEGESMTQTPISVILRAGGERTIVTARNFPSSCPKVLPEEDWLHLGPFHGDLDKLSSIVQPHQVKSGQGISFNPSIESLEERSRGLLSLLKTVTILFVNLHEAIVLTRLPQRTPVEELLSSLRRMGPKTICITDGERGAYVADDEVILSAPALVTQHERIDATGAGDAFTTGFLASYLSPMELASQGALLRRSLGCGIASSAAAIGEVGATRGLLDYEAIMHDAERVKVRSLG
ncbi:MAG: carbohydrate kinase family protein [Candidatus Berkelbacteria bacterium]|nr:MAG: carbohydrate kinase family protein [Candidatus Berkelbacteria bacterium]QQG51540.1 MAG: carbohydrate kinase family protein [Candidatus Berkelbacteria bacterium]